MDLDPADIEASDDNSPAQLVALLDRSPTISSVVRSSQTDLRHKLESERRGLFYLLEEEASMPGASDASFLDRLFSHYNDRGKIVNPHKVIALRLFTTDSLTHSLVLRPLPYYI